MLIPSTRAPLAAALAFAVGGSPAFAAAKEAKITVPASAVKDASSKLCMPRAMSRTVGKDKGQPTTLCQTVDEWAQHGVTVVTK